MAFTFAEVWFVEQFYFLRNFLAINCASDSFTEAVNYFEVNLHSSK